MDKRILTRFGLEMKGNNTFSADNRGLQYLIRPLSGPAELAACMELQRITWGMPEADIVPENVLVALLDCHLPPLGAFGATGRMLAILIGLGGVDPVSQRPILHSHMLAVVSDLRGSGIGTTMKIAQAQMATRLGITVIEWTVEVVI